MTTDDKDSAEPAVKPHVIDLEAEDVTVEPGAPAAAPPPPPPRRKSGGSARWIVAALIAGLIGGGWFYRDVLSTYLPTNAVRDLEARTATLEAGTKTTGEQLLAVSTAAEQANKAAAALEAALKDATQTAATAQSAVTGLNQRLASIEKSLQSTKAGLETLRTAIASGGTSGGGVDPAALAAIGQKLDALEKDMASLKAGGAPAEDASAISALRQTLSDIQAKIAAGTPYRQELDRILRIVPSLAANEVLATYADTGLANATGLAGQLRNIIPTLPKPAAEAPATSSGYLDSFWNALTSIVTIRDIGETDWQALAEKSAAFTEAGDLAQAIAQIDSAEGATPTALSEWRDKAVSRLKLEAAVTEMAKAVNLVITAKGGGQ